MVMTQLVLHLLSPIFITSKIVKKVITADYSKVSGIDCIQMVALKNCQPELS